MVAGGYSIGFRTGSEQGTDLEILLDSLNQARGSALSTEPGTVTWVENMAIARTLYATAETIRRFSLQFDPQTMTSFIPRWEKILRIVPDPNATLNARRAAIAAKFTIIGVAPLTQNVQDFIRGIIGDTFVELIHISSSVAITTYPGGLILPGVLNLPPGDWRSGISHLPVRLAQRRYSTDAEFYEEANAFNSFLYDFLPAYMTFDWGRYGLQLAGTISLSAGSTGVVGTGTAFITGVAGQIVPGEGLEVYDDAGNLHTLIVSSVQTDTNLTVQAAIGIDVTNQVYSRFGFYADTVNLDNSFLGT